MDPRELRPAREHPSGAAAALVGLLSLGFAFSPHCGPRASVPDAPPPTPTAPMPVASDAGVAEPTADAGVAQEREELGVVAGQIVAPDGEVEGTLVSLAGSGVWPARQVRAAADGGFRFEHVPSGVYGVNARRGSRVAEPREGFWLDAGGRVFLALRLEPGARLTGRVVSSLGGAPVADAELRLSADSLALAPRSTRTDADGRFRIEGLLRRSQRLSVRAPGFVPVIAREVRPGRELSLRLVPAAQVSGVVYDSLDHPVAGARVELLATGHARGQSVLQAPNSQVDAFSFGSANLGMTSGPVPPIPPTPADTGAEPWPSSGGPSALTDAQGRYRILGVAPGASVLLASHRSYAPGVSAPLRLRPGQHLEDQTLVLPQGSLIRGRVVDSRDFPAAGVAIVLRTEREPLPRMTSSTSDGSFEFAHVLGPASLTARAPGLPERRERLEAPAEGELVVTLRLEQAFIELEGRVLDEAGFPLAGAELRCRSLRYQAPSSQLARSGQDGGFRFRGLPAPPWSIDVRAPGRVARELELDEAPTAGLELRLEPAGELRLALRSAFDDAPLPAARVWVTRGEGRFEGQATPGGYRVSGLPAGPLSLQVEAPGFLPLHRELELVAHPGSPLVLDLGVLRLAPGGRLEGDVVDAHGEPVGGAQIELNGEPVAGGLSDAEGHFLLIGIIPDTYHVSAMHAQAGSGDHPGSVTVYAEQTSPGVHIVLSGVLPSLDEGPASLRSGVAVSLRTVSGRVEITDVVAGSTAARAGLRAGDELLSVDGQQVSLAAEARSSLRGPIGERATLSIRRGGRVRRLVVRRERYSPP